MAERHRSGDGALPYRTDIERALADVRAAKAPLDAAEARLVAALDRVDGLIPLKRAAGAMRISDETARKRAARGDGVKRGGRWFFTASYVEARRRG